MKISFLILLCVIGFISLPIFASASSPRVLHNINSNSAGLDWTQHVVRNVTGTGTLIANDAGVIIVCDNGESYTNRFGLGVTVVNPNTRRVFFTIGIVDLSGIVLIPETPPQSYVVYQMQDLPQDADFISVSKLFGATQKAVTFSPISLVIIQPVINGLMSRKSVYGLDYNASYDLNSDGIINLRDIAMAVRNCEQFANAIA